MVKKKNILIVDFPRSSQAKLVEVLEEEGFSINTICSSELVRSRWQHTSPDIILLNTEILGIDGYKYCRRAKANNTFSAIPIYLLSTKSEDDIISSCLGLGASGWLYKPFNEMELNLRIRDYLNSYFGIGNATEQMAIA